MLDTKLDNILTQVYGAAIKTQTVTAFQRALSSLQITQDDGVRARMSILGSPCVDLHVINIHGDKCHQGASAMSIRVQTMEDLLILSRHLGREIIEGIDCTMAEGRGFQVYKLDGGRDEIEVDTYVYV